MTVTAGFDTVPGAHDPSAVPGLMPAEEQPQGAPNYSPREARSWRPVPSFAPAAGAYTDDQAGGTIYPHDVSSLPPDPRRTWGGTAGMTTAANPQLLARPEQLVAGEQAELIDYPGVIDRPRAGSIGTDPTRPSHMPKWFYFAPFDQWAAYGAPAHAKIEQPSPVASLPLWYTDDVKDAIPSTGGSTGYGKEADAGPSVNTVRLLPGQSDAYTITTNPDQGTSYAETQRARGWRL